MQKPERCCTRNFRTRRAERAHRAGEGTAGQGERDRFSPHRLPAQLRAGPARSPAEPSPNARPQSQGRTGPGAAAGHPPACPRRPSAARLRRPREEEEEEVAAARAAGRMAESVPPPPPSSSIQPWRSGASGGGRPGVGGVLPGAPPRRREGRQRGGGEAGPEPGHHGCGSPLPSGRGSVPPSRARPTLTAEGRGAARRAPLPASRGRFGAASNIGKH